MTTFSHDLRFALRMLRKNPGFAAVAILTLALGIGANTAIFSVVHAVLLRPLPYPADRPEHVVVMTEHGPNSTRMGVSYPDFADWREQSRTFSEMAGWVDSDYNLTGVEQAVQVLARHASHNYFSIMGIQPLLGRLFNEQEDRAGGEPVVVLNHPMWQNQFGGDPGIIGRAITLNEKSYTVIGVLPPNIEPSEPERIYMALEPWADNDNIRDRGNHLELHALGRLKPGVRFEDARTEMEALARRLEQTYADTNSGVGPNVWRFDEFRTRDYRATLWMLLGAVGFVLLIACTNVANLLLARAAARQRESAIRSALGAGSLRLLRQSLTESVLLALIGGGLGLALAFASLGVMRNLITVELPGMQQLQINWVVLGYSVAVSLVTGILFGFVPAVWNSRLDLNRYLKEGGKSSGSALGRRRLGRGLLVAEVALATLLLIGAGLLIRTVFELNQASPGFETANLLTMQMQLTPSYDANKRIIFYRQLRERIEALPGVESASAGLSIPMLGSTWISIFTVADQPVPPRAELPISAFNPIAAGYFEAMGIPLVRGRVFSESDALESEPVIVVNQRLARTMWPGQDPLGKRLKQGWPEDEGERYPWRTVVGVTADVKQANLSSDTLMETYIPLTQMPIGTVRLAIRTANDPLTLVEPVKAEIAALDPNLPVRRVQTMEQIVDSSIAPRRFIMTLLTVFAALALVLAAIGIYGVIAYSVAQRTQEMGLRLAIGARRADVFRLVVRQGLGLACVGVLIGVASAFWLPQTLQSLLFEVSASDPLVFSAVAVVLGAVAVAACCVPAWRAMRVDPMVALRYE